MHELTSKLKAFLACMFKTPKIQVANPTCPLPTWATSIPYQLMCSKKEQQMY